MPTPRRLFLILSPMFLLLFAAVASAEVKTQTIEYKQGDTTLKGYLAYDDAQTVARPGVIVVHEWMGLNAYAKKRAEQLAGLGYVALAADIYGDGHVASGVEEAGKLATQFKGNRALLRARVTAALETLKQDKHVDPARIACIGYCFGGTTALELARSGADIKGVVSIHGGLDPGTPPAGATPRIVAKVLVLHGADDPTVPPAQVAAFQDEMRAGQVDWQFIAYGGAVHGFSNPDADKLKLAPVEYNAAADRRSWQDMLVFFHEIFGETDAK